MIVYEVIGVIVVAFLLLLGGRTWLKRQAKLNELLNSPKQIDQKGQDNESK